MSAIVLPSDVAALATPALDPAGVIALRRRYFADGAIGLREGEELFEVARLVGEGGCPDWAAFFVEAITVMLTGQAEPHGYLPEGGAAWLIGQVRRDGRVLLGTEFAALLSVLERAREVPDELAGFALATVRDVVLSGEGAAVTGERHAPGVVTAADVAALRRVLFAATSEGFGHVSRAEAEVLFDIAEATADAPNDPAFADLFARAVGNHVMALGRAAAPSRAEALRREAWLDEGPGSFFGRALAGAGSAWSGRSLAAILFGAPDPAEEEARDRAEAAAAGAAVVTQDEAAWIRARITRDGRLSAAERALLRFLHEESGALAPALRPLLDAA